VRLVVAGPGVLGCIACSPGFRVRRSSLSRLANCPDKGFRLSMSKRAAMAHMKGIEPAEAGWFTRLVYWFVQRKFGQLTGKSRLVEPVKIAAYHPRLLRAMGQMESGVDAARAVPANLKKLASLQVATLVGCPF